MKFPQHLLREIGQSMLSIETPPAEQMASGSPSNRLQIKPFLA
jgi:hypothetical protein